MKKAIVFLQARVSSTRLPGKVLLPIGGLPLAVLAAKRAGNTGRRTVIVTSLEKSDDVLCELLLKHNVEFFRGDLNNVLSRFVDATDGMNDDDLVFRLTADNVFPDGEFLDDFELQFRESGTSYMSCSHLESGMPYGVSAELTTVQELRTASNEATDAYDLEHVTPYIKRNTDVSLYKHILASKSHDEMRCTIDTLDDYLSIESIFRGVKNSVDVSLSSLVEFLSSKK